MIDVDKITKNAKTALSAASDLANNGKVYEVYIVTQDAQGNQSMFYSGNWQNLAKAGALLQAEFTAHTLLSRTGVEKP